MRAFNLTRIFTVILALLFIAAGTEILAQGKGRGGDRQRGREQRDGAGQRGGHGAGHVAEHLLGDLLGLFPIH